MKTLSVRSVEVATGASTTVTTQSGDVVLVASVAEETFSLPAQQVTVGNFPAANRSWSRAIRLTNEAVMVIRNGVNWVAAKLEVLVQMAVALEPGLSWPPNVTSHPADATAVIGGTNATFSVGLGPSELTTPSYQWQYEDVTAKATATLTSDNTNVADGDMVTIGTKTYTFKTTLTSPAVEGEVHIGADADGSLLNLIRAINHSGTPGTDYNCANASEFVTAATSVTSHAFAVEAITAGEQGNLIATSELSSHLIWSGDTLTDGGWSAATGTINNCVYTNDTSATLTCDPSAEDQDGVAHRCKVTNLAGSTASNEAILTITS